MAQLNPLVAAMMAGRGGRMTIGRGLNSLGAGLAAGMNQRSDRQRLMEAMQGLAGPEMSYEDTPPIATGGQYRELMDALDGTVSNQFTPEQRLAAQDRTGQAVGAIRENTRGIVGAANAQREKLIKAASLPGEIGKIAQMALLKQSGAVQPDPLQGASRYMNLGGGKVMDMVTKEELDYSESPMADPSKRYKVVDGKLVDLGKLDKQGSPTVVIDKYDEGDTKLQNIGAGGNMMVTAAVTTKDGKVTSVEHLGEPWDRKQYSEVRTGPLPIARSTQGAVEREIVDIEDAQARLDTILKKQDPANPEAGGYNPRWMTYEGRGIQWGKKQVDKSMFGKWFLGAVTTQKQEDDFWADYDAYTNWAASTWDNLNRYIKFITGAQMSEKEVPRIKNSVANIEDGPRAFASKGNATKAYLDEALARKRSIIESGIVPAGIRDPELYGEGETYNALYDREMKKGVGHEIAMERVGEAFAADMISGTLQPGFGAGYEVDTGDLPPNWEDER